LANAGLCDPDKIHGATEEQLLVCLDGDRQKLAVVRDGGKRILQHRAQAAKPAVPVLEAYVA
jgi:hypothetical protein